MAYFCAACELRMILTFLKDCKSKTKCNKHKQTSKKYFLKRRVCNRYCILPLKPKEFIKCLFIKKKCFPINVSQHIELRKYILKYWAYYYHQINFSTVAFPPVTFVTFPHYAFLTPFLQRKPVFQEKLYIYSFVLSCNIYQVISKIHQYCRQGTEFKLFN